MALTATCIKKNIVWISLLLSAHRLLQNDELDESFPLSVPMTMNDGDRVYLFGMDMILLVDFGFESYQFWVRQFPQAS